MKTSEYDQLLQTYIDLSSDFELLKQEHEATIQNFNEYKQFVKESALKLVEETDET